LEETVFQRYIPVVSDTPDI